MKRIQLYALGMAISLTLFSAAAMAVPPNHPSITGTYKLVSRTGKDNSVKTAPNVIGLQTFTKTYRNFNVAWTDANGKTFSYSVISRYTLTDTTYTETKLYSIMDDEISGAGVKYDFTSQSKTVPVTYQTGKLTFKLPFDPVSVVFEGDKMVATGDTDFIDSWSKVR